MRGRKLRSSLPRTADRRLRWPIRTVTRALSPAAGSTVLNSARIYGVFSCPSSQTGKALLKNGSMTASRLSKELPTLYVQKIPQDPRDALLSHIA